MTATDRFLPLSGVAIKAPCRVATTGNVTLSGLQTVDGVALADGDRALVAHQTNTAENGIYVANGENWRRALDLTMATDVVAGTLVLVSEGTQGANAIFRLDPL